VCVCVCVCVCVYVCMCVCVCVCVCVLTGTAELLDMTSAEMVKRTHSRVREHILE
jgi:hypothetical protein